MSAKAPPLRAVVGWVDTNVKRDAVEYAKGYALKHMDAPKIGFYATMQFLGGHLWEVQEGGSGLSYLPAVATALAKGVEPAWFRVGQRAFSVQLRDGRPYCILLPKEDSPKLFAIAENEIHPSGRMRDVVVKGTSVLTTGAATFAAGFLFLLANAGAYVGLEAFAPEARRLDVDTLPHRQWGMVSHVAPTMYVEALRFSNGKWDAAMKPLPTAEARKEDGKDAKGQETPKPVAAKSPAGLATRPAMPVPPLASAKLPKDAAVPPPTGLATRPVMPVPLPLPPAAPKDTASPPQGAGQATSPTLAPRPIQAPQQVQPPRPVQASQSPQPQAVKPPVMQAPSQAVQAGAGVASPGNGMPPALRPFPGQPIVGPTPVPAPVVPVNAGSPR